MKKTSSAIKTYFYFNADWFTVLCEKCLNEITVESRSRDQSYHFLLKTHVCGKKKELCQAIGSRLYREYLFPPGDINIIYEGISLPAENVKVKSVCEQKHYLIVGLITK